MAEPFLSEIRIMSFVFAPKGWALCNGQLLPINQNQGLFSLLGTTFGGDGRVNFALPDLRGRTPMHVGSGHTLGERGGEQAHTLTMAELPTHTHVVNGSSNAADAAVPTGNLLGAVDNTTFGNAYAAASNVAPLAPGAVSNMGGSQAHLNMQPFLTLNFCIALQGIFPSPT
jgi:microcystin-dependent protein